MRPLRYSINVTLDGCVDHREGYADEELHRRAGETLERADALIFGRVTYQMMEYWRPEAHKPNPESFATIIDRAKKYVVSDTLESVDWNAELVRRDQLEATVRELKAQPGRGLLAGGVTMPLALANLGLIDEYEFVVHPLVAGHGPTLFAGLTRKIELKLVDRIEYASGVVAQRYEVKR